MTDEEWAMVQRTPEWDAERLAHIRWADKERARLSTKKQRRIEAMEARHSREMQKLVAAVVEERDRLEQEMADRENAGLRRVFAKYGLKEGRA